MDKDYSEYHRTEYDKYRLRRSNTKNVILDYFVNKAIFYTEDKTIRIKVDGYNEYLTMLDFIDEVEKAKAEREGRTYTPPDQVDTQLTEEIDALQLRYDYFKKKFEITLGQAAGLGAIETGVIEDPMVNLFSDSYVTLNYGEGILDFIYADFRTPLRKPLANIMLADFLREISEDDNSGNHSTSEKDAVPEKVYNRNQEIVEDFYDYVETFHDIREVAYASLYSAICPPLFKGGDFDQKKKLLWYGNYLLHLQQEYKELIEFCYDEDFHPDILGKLYPSERFALYRDAKDLPMFLDRTEELQISRNVRGGSSMPFGMKSEELVRILTGMNLTLSEEEKAFAEELGMSESHLAIHLRHPFFMSVKYDFRSVAEILELEFTKMFEQNVRFRKCKRCGKYFIMKGNYDTNYCDRVAEGETRTCQELAAIENYRAKIAGNKAIPIYNKYYKRYAARVKVRQIKENEFKKWKYQAMSKRDECSDGKITPEEFTEWMEAAFPNRKPKK